MQHDDAPNANSQNPISLDEQLDAYNGDEAEDESRRRRTNGAVAFAAALLFPARAAVSVLGFLTGQAAARRMGARGGSGLAGGVIAALMVQCALPRRRAVQHEALKEAAERGVGWTEAVRAVAQVVRRFSAGLVPRLHVLDQRLVLLAHGRSARALAADARRMAPQTSTRTLAAAARYCDFAVATYGYGLLRALGLLSPAYDWRTDGTRAVDVAVWHLGLSSNAVRRARLDGDTIGVPRHLVAIDSSGALVIAIRGTNSLADVVTDLLCETVPFGEGYAHGGMADAARALYASLGDVLAAEGRRRIAVCGHSLGAGVALLLTKLLLNAGYRATCYAFAPCPVFGPLDAVDDAWNDAVECFVHDQDVVAALSLASARRLAVELEAAGLDASDERRGAARTSKDPRLKLIHPLYIPTRSGVHWLLPVEETKGGRRRRADIEAQFPRFPWERWDVPPSARPKRRYQSVLVDATTFQRMLITPRCVGCHFPSSYVRALAALNADNPAVARRWRIMRASRRQHNGSTAMFGELGEL